MGECTNCARLQAEVARLEFENQKQRYEIARLKAIIDQAQGLCAMIATEANAILSKNSPKGVWAYNKGKRAAADRISTVLYY